MIITTKITRHEMTIAKRAGPQYQGKLTKEQKKQATIMLESIMQRMDRLIISMCRSSYTRFQHFTDRAMSIEDLISIVKSGLVLGIYRYKKTGKYEPYNYLMGVINIILRNVHNWRNRKKRIPPGVLLSIDSIGNDDERNLGQYLSSSNIPFSSGDIDRHELKWGWKKLKNNKWVRLRTGNKIWDPIIPPQINVTIRQKTDKSDIISASVDILSMLMPYLKDGKINNFTTQDIFNMIIVGNSIESIVGDIGAPVNIVKKFIKENITTPLASCMI